MKELWSQITTHYVYKKAHEFALLVASFVVASLFGTFITVVTTQDLETIEPKLFVGILLGAMGRSLFVAIFKGAVAALIKMGFKSPDD